MIKFYLPSSNTKFKFNYSKDSFMIGALGTYKKLILDKVNIHKCDAYDNKILDYIYNSDQVHKVKPRKHLCYDIIIYSTKWIKCLRDDSGEYLYCLDIPVYNPFGDKETVDLILRLIEYGNLNDIRPYKIFNDCLLDLKEIHNKKLNSM